eukprot:scaffold3771_cov43-Prasinocladus_malaysianus.AAC.1
MLCDELGAACWTKGGAAVGCAHLYCKGCAAMICSHFNLQINLLCTIVDISCKAPDFISCVACFALQQRYRSRVKTRSAPSLVCCSKQSFDPDNSWHACHVEKMKASN